MQIIGEHGGCRVFAHQSEEAFLALDINQFLVGARFDVNDHRMGAAAGRHGHDGLLHRFELAAAVGGDDEVGLRCRPAAGIEDQKGQRTQPGTQPGSGQTNDSFHMKVQIVIGPNDHAKSREHFVCWQSARGLAHSMTLRAVRKSPGNASRLGLRRPSAAFPRGVSNCAQVN